MIPIVDCDGNVSGKSDEIFNAIENVGIVYLKNFGIPFQEVHRYIKNLKHRQIFIRHKHNFPR